MRGSRFRTFTKYRFSISEKRKNVKYFDGKNIESKEKKTQHWLAISDRLDGRNNYIGMEGRKPNGKTTWKAPEKGR